MEYQKLIISIKNILNRGDLTSTEKYINSKNLIFFKKELKEITETEHATLSKFLDEWYSNKLKYSII